MSVQTYLIIMGSVITLISLVSASCMFVATTKELNEKVKLDVTYEQMLSIEKKIREFYKEHNILAIDSISEVAHVFNVEQGGVEPGLIPQGSLKEMEDSDKKIVVFKEGLSETEKRFVFAHEIAHLLQGDSIPVSRPEGRNKAKNEQLADYTAAAMLMPIELVYKKLVEENYKESSTRKRTAVVRKMCEEYDVTEVIALRRIKEVYAIKSRDITCEVN